MANEGNKKETELASLKDDDNKRENKANERNERKKNGMNAGMNREMKEERRNGEKM